MKSVILSGGSGLRLWPYSRARLPKQFLPLFDGRSLFSLTVERLSRLCPAEDIHVIATAAHREAVETHFRAELGVPPPELIPEPFARNTAPAIALSVKHLLERGLAGPDEAILFCPADHGIEPVETFAAAIRSAVGFCEERQTTVILGIVPRAPETGYGYIETGEQEAESFYRVARFVEKPSREKAVDYCARGGYLWNSGMVVSTPALLIDEFRRHHPALHALITATAAADLSRALEALAPVSFDYAVLEKTDRLAIRRIDIAWNDFGSWESIHAWFPRDEAGNGLRGDVMALEVERSLVWGGNKLVAAFGVRDLIIVDTPDALFVGDRRRSQDVKEIVTALGRAGRREAALPVTLRRDWGNAALIHRTDSQMVLKVSIRGAAECALPPRPCPAHLITLERGVTVVLDGASRPLGPDTSLDLPARSSGRLVNAGTAETQALVICRGSADTAIESIIT